MSTQHIYTPSSPDWVEEAERLEPKTNRYSYKKRINSLTILIALIAAILAAQLVRFQVFGQKAAASPVQVSRKLLPRGVIVDAQGHPLAIQRFRYEIVASPLIMSPKTKNKVAEELAPLLGTTEEDILIMLEHPDENGNVFLSTDVPPEVGEAIKAKNFGSVGVYIYPKRYHPEGNLASHVLGFVSANNVGHYGLEEYFNNILVAPTNEIKPMPDLHLDKDSAALGDVNDLLPESPFVPSVVRRDFILTLDRNLQYIAETELKKGIEEYQAESGVVIILDPKTSAILAMAGYPDYNPDEITQVESENVFINPAISKIYEPGSVFKLITFAAALNEGIITPESRYNDTDEYTYFQQTVQNWDREGRGEVTAQQALAESLNVTTAKIAVETGAEAFYRTVSKFGFGVNTRVELAYEASGIVHKPNSADWVPGYLATNSFGQAISVTPLQMANAVAAIAAGGVLNRPHIVKMAIKGDTLHVKEPEHVSRAITPEAARTLTQMMIAAANHTKKATIPGYAIAGKTGTAEIPGLGGYKENRTIATFVGFFPADDPQFLILVKLEKPKTSAWASQTAAPVFRNIAQDIINLYGIPPDEIRLKEEP